MYHAGSYLLDGRDTTNNQLKGKDFLGFFSQMNISYHIIYLPTPPLGQDMTQGQFLSGVLTGLNSEFSFS